MYTVPLIYMYTPKTSGGGGGGGALILDQLASHRMANGDSKINDTCSTLLHNRVKT